MHSSLFTQQNETGAVLLVKKKSLSTYTSRFKSFMLKKKLDNLMMPSFDNPFEKLTVQDIWPFSRFGEEKPTLLPLIMHLKKQHQVFLGPDISVVFESKLLVWWHIQEMLLIEESQDIEGELEAYNPLIPDQNQVTATLMIEISDPVQRQQRLAQWWNILSYVSLNQEGVKSFCQPLSSFQAATYGDPKAFSVNFISFPITLQPDLPATLTVQHPEYSYQTVLPTLLVQALKQGL